MARCSQGSILEFRQILAGITADVIGRQSREFSHNLRVFLSWDYIGAERCSGISAFSPRDLTLLHARPLYNVTARDRPWTPGSAHFNGSRRIDV
jgi:hypothetical protein